MRRVLLLLLVACFRYAMLCLKYSCTLFTTKHQRLTSVSMQSVVLVCEPCTPGHCSVLGGLLFVVVKSHLYIAHYKKTSYRGTVLMADKYVLSLFLNCSVDRLQCQNEDGRLFCNHGHAAWKLLSLSELWPPCGAGAPLFPLVHLLPHLFPFSLFPFFHWLYLFSSVVHPFPFYQNSPTPFPGRMS